MDDAVIGYSHIQLSCVIPTCFPKWLYQVTFPSSGTQKFTGLSVFLNIVRKTVRLSSFASLAGVKWYLLETLICISLLTKVTDHLYIYLFDIPIFSSKKCLFVGVFFVFVLLIYEFFLHILGTTLSVICTTNTFSQLFGLSFHDSFW